MSFSDPFGAEAHVDVPIEIRDDPRDAARRTRVDGAAQDHKMTGDEIVDQRCDDPGDGIDIGAEMPVDRCADNDDDVLGACDGGRIRGSAQASGFQDLRKRGRCARLLEGHDFLVDGVDRGGVGVEEDDIQSLGGKCDSQWQADVAATTDDNDIVLEMHSDPSRTSDGPLRVGHEHCSTAAREYTDGQRLE